VNMLLAAVAMVRAIMKTEPIASLIEEEGISGPAGSSPEQNQACVRSHTQTAFRPVGTCHMGTDERADVGPALQFRGFENLWIADGSIMPDLLSGNTNATCMMIGKKLGRELAACQARSRTARDLTG
jgi:choline dehydrogenase-like flavoprotein